MYEVVSQRLKRCPQHELCCKSFAETGTLRRIVSFKEEIFWFSLFENNNNEKVIG